MRLAEIAPGVCIDFEDLPPDVREHGDCHRQRPRESIRPVGQAHGTSVPQTVCRPANARASTALNLLPAARCPLPAARCPLHAASCMLPAASCPLLLKPDT